MAEFHSPLVNSARLPDYVGHTVRIVGKVLRLLDATSEAIISASDGGEVRIKFIKPENITSTYLEIVGNVVANDAVKAHAIMELGDDFELSYMNFAVELTHNPKFNLNLKHT